VKQVSAALPHFFTPEITDSLWFGAQLKPGSGPLEIRAVEPGSPASRAGLKAGDRIVEVNGKAPQGLIDCNRLLASPDRLAHLVLERTGRRETASVRLISFDEMARRRLGLGLSALNDETASRLGVSPDSALVIKEVETGGPAERAELRPGYLVVAVDDQKTASMRQVAQVISGKQRGDIVQLTVLAPRRLGGRVQLGQGTVSVELR
jgi:S1-C subfamily serine protease